MYKEHTQQQPKSSFFLFVNDCDNPLIFCCLSPNSEGYPLYKETTDKLTPRAKLVFLRGWYVTTLRSRMFNTLYFL